jgi:putative addiction module killer protein
MTPGSYGGPRYIREIHAIRLKIQDETAGMTPAERSPGQAAFPSCPVPDKKLSIPSDYLYPMGYYINMITIRETELFKTWIRGLRDRVTQAIINARIRRISCGNFGDSKPVGGGISELRIDYGPGFRVYFTRRGYEYETSQNNCMGPGGISGNGGASNRLSG